MAPPSTLILQHTLEFLLAVYKRDDIALSGTLCRLSRERDLDDVHG